MKADERLHCLLLCQHPILVMRIRKTRPRTESPVISVCTRDFLKVHVCLMGEACHTCPTERVIKAACVWVSDSEHTLKHAQTFLYCVRMRVCTIRSQSCSIRHDHGLRARNILYFHSQFVFFSVCFAFLIQHLTSKTCQSKLVLKLCLWPKSSL